MLELPEGVHAVKAKGRHYYYWHPNRGTAFAGESIPLGTDASDPEFWTRLRVAQGHRNGIRAGTFSALIAEFQASAKWRKLRQRTREHYAHQLGRVEAAWGDMAVAGLTVKGIYGLRAEYEETPVAANHLVSVLRTVLKWGLEHDYGIVNPAREIAPLDLVDEQSAQPWPEEAYRIVMACAPEHIRRATFLGRATGQRRSDLVKLGKRHRYSDGLRFQIGKLRDRWHQLPLTADQITEIGSWSCSDTGPWIVSPTGRPMSGDHLQSSLGRFIAKTPSLQGFDLKMHGLRAMACCDRKMLGFENKAIGSNIGMSPGQVERYIRHIDKVALARQVRDGLERPQNGIVKPVFQ